MEQSPRERPKAVTVFGIINLCYAVWMLLLVPLFIAVVLYGIFLSGDPLDERVAGSLGGAIVMLYCLVGTAVHATAGIGLLRLRRWGYYAHIAGAVLQFWSCVGALYPVLALVFAIDEEFKRPFYPPRPPPDQPGGSSISGGTRK